MKPLTLTPPSAKPGKQTLTPAHSHAHTVGVAVIKNRTQVSPKQDRRGGGPGNHILQTAHQGSPYCTKGCRFHFGLWAGGRRRVSRMSPAKRPPTVQLPRQDHCRRPSPGSAAPAAGVGVGARGQCGGKMSEHRCRMSSTTWFWNTMVMGMLVSSVSGRSSVGPNTIATLCTDMRF